MLFRKESERKRGFLFRQRFPFHSLILSPSDNYLQNYLICFVALVEPSLASEYAA